MSLVKIKEKYQVTLPVLIRAAAGLAVGDLLEVKVKQGKITLTPKSAIDRELALALKDYEVGRFIGPFNTAQSAVRAIRRRVK